MDRQPLARDDVRRFRQEGFLIIERFAPPAEVEAVAPIYDRLFETRAGWDEGKMQQREDAFSAGPKGRYAPGPRHCGR